MIPSKGKFKLRLMMAVLMIVFSVGDGAYRHLSAGGEETYKGLKLFTDVIDLVEKNYVDDVDSKDLVEKAIQGMVQSLDPHSAFLNPEAFRELQVDTHGEFGGIGIVISEEKGALVVVSPIEGTPAQKAGVIPGDKIVKIDGESTAEMMLWEAVNKMRGPKGTSVVITVTREGASEPIELSMIRDVIPIESVRAFVLTPGYGYVRVSNFQDNTTSDLEAALREMESSQKPLKGVILDLRNNPGGLLNQAVSVSDLFLDKGAIVSIKGRMKKHTRVFNATPNRVSRSYPMTVLINGGSASASEIVAGALQDNKRALILGTPSFGKGSVQTVEALRDGYGLKFTIARYYTPSGKSIQAQGIHPDILLKQKPAVEEAASREERIPLREKDLKNHLNAEPGEKKPEADSEMRKESEAEAQPVFQHGPLTREALERDNLVMRALEILIGHEIFKGTGG